MSTGPTTPDTGTGATPVRALGLVGSLRRASFNAMLMRAAVELAPESLEIEVFDRLAELPFYDEDIADEPAVVADLRAAIARSDALVVATPEYNFGIPGVLKNALDWASMPARTSAMHGKTAAIMGASPGMLGTARGQQHLRQMFVFTQTYAVLQPEILVSYAGDKFDDDGTLTDELTAKLVRRQLQGLVDLTHRLRA